MMQPMTPGGMTAANLHRHEEHLRERVRELEDGIRQHRESVNRGLWPPSREDHMLWALLDRKDNR